MLTQYLADLCVNETSSNIAAKAITSRIAFRYSAKQNRYLSFTSWTKGTESNLLSYSFRSFFPYIWNGKIPAYYLLDYRRLVFMEKTNSSINANTDCISWKQKILSIFVWLFCFSVPLFVHRNVCFDVNWGEPCFVDKLSHPLQNNLYSLPGNSTWSWSILLWLSISSYFTLLTRGFMIVLPEELHKNYIKWVNYKFKC